MEDAKGPYEFEEDAMVENIHAGNVGTKSNGWRNQEAPLDIPKTMRSLRVELISYRIDNERIIKDWEEHNQLNVSMLQSLICIWRKINHGHNPNNVDRSRDNLRIHSHRRSHSTKRTSWNGTYRIFVTILC